MSLAFKGHTYRNASPILTVGEPTLHCCLDSQTATDLEVVSIVDDKRTSDHDDTEEDYTTSQKDQREKCCSRAPGIARRPLLRRIVRIHDKFTASTRKMDAIRSELYSLANGFEICWEWNDIRVVSLD